MRDEDGRMGNTVETLRDAVANQNIVGFRSSPSTRLDELDAALAHKTSPSPSPMESDDSKDVTIPIPGTKTLRVRPGTRSDRPDDVDDSQRLLAPNSRGGSGDVERGSSGSGSNRPIGSSVQQTIAGYFRATSLFSVVLLVVDCATFAVAMSTQSSRPRVLGAPQIAIACVGFSCTFVSIAALLGISMYFATRAHGQSSSSSRPAKSQSTPASPTIHAFWDPLTNFVSMLVSMFSGATVALSMLLMVIQATKEDSAAA